MADIDVVPKKSTPWAWVAVMIAIVLVVLWMAGMFSPNRGNRVGDGHSLGHHPLGMASGPAARSATRL